MESNHLFIWFRDTTRDAEGACGSKGCPEALFDSLCRGRVLEKRFLDEETLCGVEVTFASKQAGAEFANLLCEARTSAGIEAWVRGVEALSFWRSGKAAFSAESPPRFSRKFFLDAARP